MTRLIACGWAPMVLVTVVAIGSFTASRLRGALGLCASSGFRHS
jgi:hypothetical protein